MASPFSKLFDGCAAKALVKQFGELDSADYSKPAKYHNVADYEGYPAVELPGPVWTDITYRDQFASDGGLERVENRTCLVRKSACVDRGIKSFQAGSWIEDPDDDQNSAWMLDEATTVWGAVFVTFGLVRIPLVAKNELRSEPN